jgi:hypothetical protein
MSEVDFVGVLSSEVHLVWSRVEPMIQKALDRGANTDYYHVDDVREMIDDRRNQLWVAIVDREIEAAFVTSINDFPQCRAFDIHWVGETKMDDWLETAWNGLVDFARAKGCHVIRGYEREAWLRVLKIKPKTQLIWALDI